MRTFVRQTDGRTKLVTEDLPAGRAGLTSLKPSDYPGRLQDLRHQLARFCIADGVLNLVIEGRCVCIALCSIVGIKRG